MNIDDFVLELKIRGVQYDSINKKHWIGSKLLTDEKDIITNTNMKVMCSKFFGREYDILTNSQQTKIRMKVFKKIRGVNNG